MIIFPAIDLMDGKCIRLKQGDFKQKTIYNANPVAVAKQYQDAGATWLHVIDLDGAETGKRQNEDVIKDIVRNTNLKLQVGGGIRSISRIKTLLDIGVERVILGTFAIEQLDNLQSLTKRYPNQIIVSVDAKKGVVTYKGWQEISKYTTLELCKRLVSQGIKTIVYTDILKDGMMQGPNVRDYQTLSNNTDLNIIASGGVSSYDDIQTLSQMNLYGAIIGKALYANKVTLKEAIICSQDVSSLV
ncbi:MAG: 1-(5-phosphoribosyl)-5-[(5-phosphoribosylamino)methylideneamino]imidazole-4-carboxamide isomerase [Candidatus Izimaplasma sp.]|nr:1-(5-phosphoribosyl)-5-[(5-phosphoribosylamino)methylideneamino]imidazole-4-carboxamide isomerase [Candidatus Izimaplasma bacterium]